MLKVLIVLLALSGSPAFAESYGCEYLKNGLGEIYPGFSRPQVVVNGDSAEVTLFLEREGRVIAKREFHLPAVKNWYADAAGNSLQWRDGQVVLHLLQLSSYCSP